MKKMKTNWIFLVIAVLFLAGCGNKTKKTVNNDRVVDGTRIIHFSGYDWRVGNSKDNRQGPGPNYFSDSKENVWLDDGGNLHLKITHRDGRWNCAKISLLESHGYGTYIFHVASRWMVSTRMWWADCSRMPMILPKSTSSSRSGPRILPKIRSSSFSRGGTREIITAIFWIKRGNSRRIGLTGSPTVWCLPVIRETWAITLRRIS